MRFGRLICVGTVVVALLGATLPLAPTGAAERVGCSWPVWLNEDTFNFAYPDESATYWGAHFPYVPGGRLVIDGRYPNTRYFSFHAYDEAQRPVDSISDFEITPRSGTNPFVDAKAGAGDRYRVFVEFEEAPKNPKPNTVYAGRTAGGQPNPAGFVFYRIYIPDDPRKPTGGVPLPTITLEHAGGSVRLPFGTCDPLPPDAGGDINRAIAERSYPDQTGRNTNHPAASNPPAFRRFYGTDQLADDMTRDDEESDKARADFEGGFLSNQQIAYLYAFTSRQYGEVVVLRVKAPSFPDTRAGASPATRRNLRYWSVCQNNGLTQRVADCTADYQAEIRNGYATVVISDPTDRPRNATRGNGVTWLAWGGAYYEGLVIYRHMLPSPKFAGAIQRVPEGKSARAAIGSYYPRAAYCTKTKFERTGWRGCFD